MITYEIEFNDQSLIKDGDNVIGVRAMVIGTKGTTEVKEPLSVDKDFGSMVSSEDLTDALELLPEFELAADRVQDKLTASRAFSRGAVTGAARVALRRSRA